MNHEDHRALAEAMGFEPVPRCPGADNGIHRVETALGPGGRGYVATPCIRCGYEGRRPVPRCEMLGCDTPATKHYREDSGNAYNLCDEHAERLVPACDWLGLTDLEEGDHV